MKRSGRSGQQGDCITRLYYGLIRTDRAQLQQLHQEGIVTSDAMAVELDVSRGGVGVDKVGV
jgi:hypothetical protein